MHLLIVGLGNPGEQYTHTRHNLGIQAVKKFVGNHAIWKKEDQFIAEVAKTTAFQAIFPLTYMNNSGQSVVAFLNFLKATPAQLVVVHDEVELPLGDVRWKESGSASGHNGLRSIIDALGTDEFRRLRLGVGRPPEQMSLDRFVLEKFLDNEQEAVEQLLVTAVKELSTILPHQPQE